jgi:hypothetical protein
VISGILLFFILIAGYGVTAAITVGIALFILIAGFAAGVPYILGFLKHKKVTVFFAFAATLVVPVLMGIQEWDDHDRSKKQLARDMARDYLESCAPNAILFTIGDNDTYPLWYAQEVEGIRPDVRIVITTLLGSDWMMDELRHKVNKSDPVDVIWTADQVLGHKRDYIFYHPLPQFRDSGYHDLYDIMKNWAGSDDPARMISRGGEPFNVFPTRKVMVPVDTDLVRRNGTVNESDSVLSEMRFDLPAKNVLYKNDLAILNIIAANKWQRPIYFTMPYNNLGFEKYLRRDGLTYRLVPVGNASPNTNEMYGLTMNSRKWAYGNADLPGVYFDEINRRQLLSIRRADIDLAFDLISKNRLSEADRILRHDDSMIRTENLPFGMTSANNTHDRISLAFLEACQRVGDKSLARKVLASLKRDLLQQQQYYESLNEVRRPYFQNEMASAKEMLQYLDQQFH